MSICIIYDYSSFASLDASANQFCFFLSLSPAHFNQKIKMCTHSTLNSILNWLEIDLVFFCCSVSFIHLCVVMAMKRRKKKKLFVCFGIWHQYVLFFVVFVPHFLIMTKFSSFTYLDQSKPAIFNLKRRKWIGFVFFFCILVWFLIK